ncbi:MAG: methionyl-tRNA formyltransferase [Steroidobacteraceae bacterium]
MSSLRIVFAGTPDFAVPALEAIAGSRHRVVACYTQPDRPAGRGRRLAESPVKACARALGLPVEQPSTLRTPEAAATLLAHAPDLVVVVAYGLLLPQVVLDVPRFGCLNIHASLLPRWRGAAPIQRAIAAGDAETGISIMRMEAGLDTGPVLFTRRMAITPEDTGGSLHDRLAREGAQMIVEAIDHVAGGTARYLPQDESRATYAAKIRTSEAVIDWSSSAPVIERLIRAFVPWPVARTVLDAGPLFIWKSHVIAAEVDAPPGTVVAAGDRGPVVATGEGALCIDTGQLPGRRPVSGSDLVNGRHLAAGMVLGRG